MDYQINNKTIKARKDGSVKPAENRTYVIRRLYTHDSVCVSGISSRIPVLYELYSLKKTIKKRQRLDRIVMLNYTENRRFLFLKA